MKKYISLILLIFTSLGSLVAQTSFKLNPYPDTELSQKNVDQLNILAVMVEFQEDSDGNTFGNGKFGSIYSQDYGNDILDPLPHDANYFSDHLLFAQNYFKKVSDGEFTLTYTVLPNIITVSKIMREYSPGPNSDELISIADLAKEVWQIADQSFQDVQFSDYDMFVIFHAGVGREIPTPGSIGLERDIPSVYFSQKGLKEIYGSEFNGFPVENGSFLIKNTAVLPSTENREIESFGEIFLQEFTINGLIVGMIASHFGLPDLFDTETGTSAIGRFGLMDGQALFAYSGIFPPEPSAWEKMYLGWIEPEEIELTDQTITLTAYEAASQSENSVVKIPINSDEYYLIENRKRDAKNDGLTVTYKIGSSTNSITFDKDYPAFSPFGADTLAGVITDIDEFDWALPGFEEDQLFDDPFNDVGLIFWHIDEGVINANIESNTINNNRDRLGVKVVEADGIFDIGEEFTNIFGEIIIGEGTKQDTWYQGNPSQLYKNRFNSNSTPPAISNSGANALININNISGIDNVMSFDFSTGESDVRLLVNKELGGEAVQVMNASQFLSVRYNSGDVSLISFDGNEIGLLPQFAGTDLAAFSNGGHDFVAGAYDDTLKVYVKGILLPFETLLSTTLSAKVSSPIVISGNDAALEFIVGLENGTIEKYSLNTGNLSEITFVESYQAFSGEAVKQIALRNDTYIAAIAENNYWNSENTALSISSNIKKLAIASGPNSNIYSIVLAENKLFFISNGQIQYTHFINSSNEVESFSVADIKSDDNNYVVYNNGNRVDAINFTGSEADLFPVEYDSEVTLTGVPLSLTLNAGDDIDLMTFDREGNIYGIDGSNGDGINPFPISSGPLNGAQPIVFNTDEARLGVIDDDNRLYLWSLRNSTSKIYWGSEYQSQLNTSSVGDATDSKAISGFFPMDRAYNWPNPVYESETYIRFFVNEDAKAEIKIFDLAGDLVDELSAQAVGGLDNEVTWNVNEIQSGVYFAHLNVTGNSGKSESKIIKIAVIK